MPAAVAVLRLKGGEVEVVGQLPERVDRALFHGSDCIVSFPAANGRPAVRVEANAVIEVLAGSEAD